MTLNNLVYCKRLRFIKTLNELTFHLLRKDGLGFGMVMVAWILLPSLNVIKHLLEICSIPNIILSS